MVCHCRDHCEKTERGQLANVHSEDDQNALLSVSSENFDHFWIGLQVKKMRTIYLGAFVLICIAVTEHCMQNTTDFAWSGWFV